MTGPYAFGCAVRRKGALYSLVCDGLGDIANLTEKFRIRKYENGTAYQEEATR
jgi:hypothetical protein